MRACIPFLVLLALPGLAQARDHILQSGSSTVFPFATLVAEEFAALSGAAPPVVEALGTGGGFKAFCQGMGSDSPDIANASRPIKDSERMLCAQNGVSQIEEFPIGYDGIVLAEVQGAAKMALTREHIWRALAYEVPVGGTLVSNPYKSWQDIDPALPDQTILVYGPPPTSGTRDSFVDMVLDHVCAAQPAALWGGEDKKKKSCTRLREDGVYVDAGENDNLIIQKISATPGAIGIFGYSYYANNTRSLRALTVDGAVPGVASILDGSYPVARSLYLYAKAGALKKAAPPVAAYLLSYYEDDASGPDGYLTRAGLVPLPTAERQRFAELLRQHVTAAGL